VRNDEAGVSYFLPFFVAFFFVAFFFFAAMFPSVRESGWVQTTGRVP